MTSCLLKNMRVVHHDALAVFEDVVGLLSMLKPELKFLRVNVNSRRQLHLLIDLNLSFVKNISQRDREWGSTSSASVDLK